MRTHVWVSTANAGTVEDELQFDRWVPVGLDLFNQRTHEAVVVVAPRHLTATTVVRAAGSFCARAILMGDEWRTPR